MDLNLITCNFDYLFFIDLFIYICSVAQPVQHWTPIEVHGVDFG
jgi:hypothetical protein